jgi:murein DD-endopeptidase MepM/ murein hydrolase activator NlpD
MPKSFRLQLWRTTSRERSSRREEALISLTNKSKSWTRVILVSLALLAGFTTRMVPTHDSSACGRGNFTAVAPEKHAVKVISRRDGERTRFYVENKELCEITMSFDFQVVNLKGNVAFPHTATFPAGQTTEAFFLESVDGTTKWEYTFTNYFKLGSNCARHDDSYSYELPYAPGKKFKVTQAYNGTFSHKGSNKYAIDWRMPEGTAVCAARAGLVVKIKDDSDTGGSNIKYDQHNNYVLIRHDDGTLGHYCHLKKGGSEVNVGQRVNAGDLIGRSGNTGFSSGPHLHFCVFKTRNGRERMSIPIKFRTADTAATILRAGRSYTAASSPVARTASVAIEPAGF